MKLVFAAVFGVTIGWGLASPAVAACHCACVNGSNQAICNGDGGLRPLCAPIICPAPKTELAPIQKPTVPPAGAIGCSQQQVWSARLQQYQWKQVCN